jgi:D-alanine-D-alanine ligase
LEALVARQPDLVFLATKCIPSDATLGVNDPNKLWVSEYLDRAGIAYTGSADQAVKLEASKQLAKQRVLDAGLASARYMIVRRELPQTLQPVALSFPLFVKPSDRGGGVGIGSDSLVRDEQELSSKISSLASKLQADALIEEYLPGREFSVSILSQADSAQLSMMPIELVTEPDERGARVLSHKVKRSNVERALEVPMSPLRTAVCGLAADVFIALGARDYGRIDIRLDSNGVPHFLEANLYPSLTDGYGSFPKAHALHSSESYEDMIHAIVDLGLARVVDDIEEQPSFYGELVTA